MLNETDPLDLSERWLWHKVDTYFDDRQKAIAVGCEVVYCGVPHVNLPYLQGDNEITITLPGLRRSKVISIEVSNAPGFAEVGNPMRVTLLDGTVLTGDTENGVSPASLKLA
jgi:hypothetical protein